MKRIKAGVYGMNASWYRDTFNHIRFREYRPSDMFRLGWSKSPGHIRCITSYEFNHA
jgi:hypothetical protein